MRAAIVFLDYVGDDQGGGSIDGERFGERSGYGVEVGAVHPHVGDDSRTSRNDAGIDSMTLVSHGDGDGAALVYVAGREEGLKVVYNQVGDEGRGAVLPSGGGVCTFNGRIGAIARAAAEGPASTRIAIGLTTSPAYTDPDAALIGVAAVNGEAAGVYVSGRQGVHHLPARGQVGRLPINMFSTITVLRVKTVEDGGCYVIEAGKQPGSYPRHLGCGGAVVGDGDVPGHLVATGEVGGRGRNFELKVRLDDDRVVAAAQDIGVVAAVLVGAVELDGVAHHVAGQGHGEGAGGGRAGGQSINGAGYGVSSVLARHARRQGEGQNCVVGHGSGGHVGKGNSYGAAIGAGGHLFRDPGFDLHVRSTGRGDGRSADLVFRLAFKRGSGVAIRVAASPGSGHRISQRAAESSTVRRRGNVVGYRFVSA